MSKPKDPAKLAEIESAQRSLAKVVGEGALTKPFGPAWHAEWWLKWALIHHAFRALRIPEGATVLDVGAGTGWTTLLLAESGYRPTGIDLAPGNVEIAQRHASRWEAPAAFQVADMESFELGSRFDAALCFDALHHVSQPEAAVGEIARHLEPGGWVLFGEPSWLHTLSPRARRVHRETGWTENGIWITRLKRHCARAGLGDFRRFFESTRPYERRGRSFLWELVRLVSADVSAAPTFSVWLAARKAGA
jgi:SAM-dependent methyltransferase